LDLTIAECRASLFREWISLERTRKRGYAHFDPRLNVGKEAAAIQRLLDDRDAISTHRFHPFIADTLKTPRFKKSVPDELGRSHLERTLKERPIAYASHWDSIIYSWYGHILSALYVERIKELGISECVSAYLRRGTSNIESAHEAFEFIRGMGECTVLAFDLKGFFDSLDHYRLKRNWCEVLRVGNLPPDHYAVYKSITRYRTVEKQTLAKLFPAYKRSIKRGQRVDVVCSPLEFKNTVVGLGHVTANPFINQIDGSTRFGKSCGIPQGSPISASLSNLYMLHFDKAMNDLALSIGGLYRRYSDDILFVCPSNAAEHVKAALHGQVNSHELTLSDTKTEEYILRHDPKGRLTSYRIAQGNVGLPKKVQYLGFEFDGSRTYIRSSSFSRYQARLRARIRKAIAAAQGPRSLGPKPFKHKLFNRSTDKGRRNFITYAQRAAKTMKSGEITKQIRNNNRKVQELFAQMQVASKTFENGN
jgi:hypothetical protein